MKLFTPDELSNPEYQDHEAISGSDLFKVFSTSPAHWKFGEQKESKALEFGIASHAMLLEPDRFGDEFVRALDPEEYPEALHTTKHLQAWLKERGQKVSGSKPELISRIADSVAISGEEVHVWEVLEQNYANTNAEKTIVPAKDFDKIELMRNSIIADKTMATMLDNGIAEHSIIGKLEGFGIANKVRPDIITAGGHLVNYKTARSVHPEQFGKHCHDLGYLLKASLEWDMFSELYGQEPAGYIFLAQEKEAPFVWKPYYLTQEQLEIGRIQRVPAQRMIEECLKIDSYPAYGSEPSPMQLPEFIIKKYQ